MKKITYPIISTAWFLLNFFALFSINDTIWWEGETWSIDRELSVPIIREEKQRQMFCFCVVMKAYKILLVVLGWATSCWILRLGAFRTALLPKKLAVVDEHVNPIENSRFRIKRLLDEIKDIYSEWRFQ
jgi:hypothetical protein